MAGGGWHLLTLRCDPFLTDTAEVRGRDNVEILMKSSTSTDGLKPELPHYTYTQNGSSWSSYGKKRYHLILYSACWCGDHGCSLKSTLSMWTSWYVFMCNYIDVLMILSFVRRGIFGYQQSSHSATTSWRQLIWLQVVPESLLSALSEDSPTREAIGL